VFREDAYWVTRTQIKQTSIICLNECSIVDAGVVKLDLTCTVGESGCHEVAIGPHNKGIAPSVRGQGLDERKEGNEESEDKFHDVCSRGSGLWNYGEGKVVGFALMLRTAGGGEPSIYIFSVNRPFRPHLPIRGGEGGRGSA